MPMEVSMGGWRLASVVLLLMASVAVADEGPTSKGPADDDSDVTIHISPGDDTIELEDLIRAVARATRTNIIFDGNDRAVRGKQIEGTFEIRTEKEQLLARFREVLFARGIVLARVGTADAAMWSIASLDDLDTALALVPEVIDLTDENVDHWERQVGRFVTTTIHVEHLRELRTTRNALTRLVSARNVGHVYEIPEARAFLVVDFAPRVAGVYRAIRRLDKPTEGTTTTAGELVAIDLKHSAAEPMAAMLRAHFSSTPPHTKDEHGRLPVPVRSARDGWPRITGDPRTNRLLVSGQPAEVARVREAVALLDQPADASKR